MKIVLQVHTKSLSLSRSFSGHHQRVFFNFTTSSRKSKNQQKLVKKDRTSYNTVSLKKSHSFLTHLTLKIIYSRNTVKFSSKHVSVWCQKKYLHQTTSWRPRTPFFKYFESKCPCISIYLFKNILFPRHSKVLSGGEERGGRLNKFLKTVCCLGLAKCFTSFYFNWNFWKFNYF